jgi:antitoxin (DNA-binding transcriptional repressor) of toxin-antitoxin stability system
MNTVSIDEIQGDFTGFLQRMQSGETWLITQYGQPIAEIKSVAPAEKGVVASPRPFGLAAGEFVVPDDFDAPLPENILQDFEGRGRE